MLIGYKRGQTGIVLRVKILDSTATTGAGKTGLSSASAGLIISTIADNESAATAYTVAGSTIESITTLGTYAAPTATKCRFKEVDSTNHKGIYEIQIADARFAVSSAKSLLVSIAGATGAAETDVCIPLRDLDPYDAVRAGLTALPNANAEAAGGLYTRGTGAGQINQPANGQIDANTVKVGGQTASAAGTVTFPGTIASTTNITAGTITTVTNLTNAPTAGDLTATMKSSVTTAASAATPAVTVSDKTGFSLSSAGVQAIWDALTSALTTVGSVGKRIADNLDAAITSRLAPTTSGRTLDVTATGEAGIDWANIGSPTTAVNLSGTTVKTATDVETDTADIQTRLPAALVSGRMDSSVGAMAANTLTASALATDAVTEIQTGLSTLDAAGVRTAVGLASANLDTQLGAIDDYIDTEVAAIKAKTDNLPASPAAAGDIPTAAAIRTEMDSNSTKLANLDATISSRSSHSVADIWNALTSGLSTAGSIGKRVVDYLTGDVFARLGAPAGASVSADIAAAKTDTAAIKAKTDNLPTDPADASDIATAFTGVNTKLDAIDDYIDTEVAAIKAKTDNLPVSPAATGDIPDAASVAAAVWAYVVEGTFTAVQVVRGIGAMLLGKVSGAETTNPVVRDLADTKDRLSWTADADGNRSDVTRDLT